MILTSTTTDVVTIIITKIDNNDNSLAWRLTRCFNIFQHHRRQHDHDHSSSCQLLRLAAHSLLILDGGGGNGPSSYHYLASLDHRRWLNALRSINTLHDNRVGSTLGWHIIIHPDQERLR
eukprot:7703498-Lingulodinium_polyedra.AAC.1